MNRLKVAACAVLAMSGASVGAWAAEPAGAGQTELGGPAVAGVCLLSQQAVLANAKAGVAASARLKQLADQAQAEVDGERGPIQADAKALAAQGRSGVPLYLVYGKGAQPVVLPQLLSEGIVVEALDNAARG